MLSTLAPNGVTGKGATLPVALPHKDGASAKDAQPAIVLPDRFNQNSISAGPQSSQLRSAP